jgi:hypothetical protein
VIAAWLVILEVKRNHLSTQYTQPPYQRLFVSIGSGVLCLTGRCLQVVSSRDRSRFVQISVLALVPQLSIRRYDFGAARSK